MVLMEHMDYEDPDVIAPTDDTKKVSTRSRSRSIVSIFKKARHTGGKTKPPKSLRRQPISMLGSPATTPDHEHNAKSLARSVWKNRYSEIDTVPSREPFPSLHAPIKSFKTAKKKSPNDKLKTHARRHSTGNRDAHQTLTRSHTHRTLNIPPRAPNHQDAMIDQINIELSDTTGIMRVSMDSMMARGESLDSLGNKATQLETDGRTFRGHTESLHTHLYHQRCMRWALVVAGLIIIMLFIAFMVFVSICGLVPFGTICFPPTPPSLPRSSNHTMN